MKKIILSFLIALAPTVSLAANSSWFKTDGAKLRLVALPSPDGKRIDAGLQIELDKGWKTYWRSPGASGLPPQISFAGSTNIASTSIDYPVPIAFGDNENLTAGYKTSVTFPIAVEPLYPGRPLELKTTGIVGICGEICVPVQFQLSLFEDGTGGSSRDVASALFQAKANLIKPSHKGFEVTRVTYAASTLNVSADIPKGANKATLLVEGPSDWYLTPVRAQKIENGTALFEVNLRDIPKDAKPAETKLRFSLISDGSGVEQEITPSRQ